MRPALQVQLHPGHQAKGQPAAASRGLGLGPTAATCWHCKRSSLHGRSSAPSPPAAGLGSAGSCA
eukprot:13694680-Alexandrium_andersonii.AAC.1